MFTTLHIFNATCFMSPGSCMRLEVIGGESALVCLILSRIAFISANNASTEGSGSATWSTTARGPHKNERKPKPRLLFRSVRNCGAAAVTAGLRNELGGGELGSDTSRGGCRERAGDGAANHCVTSSSEGSATSAYASVQNLHEEHVSF